jgi:hypothetical protein
LLDSLILVQEDAMEGEGTLRSGGAGGGVYIGTSRANVRHGRGHMLWPNGDSYTGQWEGGKMQVGGDVLLRVWQQA